MTNSLYSLNNVNNTYTTTPFTPTGTNWYLSASKGGQNIYFQNLSSFKSWSSTCCQGSRNAIFGGNYNGWSINYNNPIKH